MAQRPKLTRAVTADAAPPTQSSFPPPGMSPRSHSPSPSINSQRSSRKPVPTYVPPMPDQQDTLNFHRRPSTVETTPTRSLVGGGPSPRSAAINEESPKGGTFTTAPELHRRRSSHSRTPSMSLGKPAYTPAYPPNMNILPPEPVPTRTRAPIESFASVEMLQGQREFQERNRGSEVFNNGRYEGRGIAGGEPPYHARRQDPVENVRQARGSQRMAGGAQLLPPIDMDAGNIANALRDHDQRRGSEMNRPYVGHGDSPEASGGSDTEASTAGFHKTPNFSFPPRNSTGSTKSSSTPAPAYSLSDDEDDSSVNYGDEKSVFANPYSSTEKLASGTGWRTEHLGTTGPSSEAYSGHRPSIVALPVYPAPSGALARSIKYKVKKSSIWFAWVTCFLAEASTIFYLYRRCLDLGAVEAKLPGKFVAGWIFLVVEVLVSVLVGVSSVFQVVTYRSTSSEPKLRLRGDKNLPSVDVFIVSAGQDDQVTYDCAIAAASMDYPAHKFRVMVLDPTNSATLERDVNRHAKSQGCPHLSYHRRQLNATVGDVFHSKANSINFGMKEASTFGIKGPAEFIAVLEADMIPERNFIRASLPALLTDQKVALVKTGQGFINLPHRLNQATSTLMYASESECDIRSGFFLRRSALTEIGGFPADSWIQDGHCEALLLGRGYKTSTVDEVLQWGMAKPTYGSQVTQMMVNRLGPLRTASRLGFFFGGEKIKLMPYWARFKALGRALNPFLGVLMLLLTIAYPYIFTYGGIIVLTPNLDSLNILLLSCLSMLVLSSLHALAWGWATGRPSPRRELQAWIYAAPYQAVALIRMLLPTWLGGYTRGSDIDLNIVALPIRPSIWKRLGWLLIDPHSGVIVAFLGSIGVVICRATRDFELGTVDVHQTALTILLTVGWPSMLWIDFVYGSIVPYTCLLFPSRLLTEKREAFLIRDTYSSVARPKHAFKTAQPFKVNHAPEFLTAALVIGWSAATVALGWTTQLFA